MRKELLERFPYALIRIDAQRQVTLANECGKRFLQSMDIASWNALLASALLSETLKGVLPNGQTVFAKTFEVAGETNYLVMIGEEPDFTDYLPAPFEQRLEDFTADPHVVTQRIIALIQDAVTFERFDLLRVDRSLRKYTYEYSIGLDIAGTLPTAYSTISNSGLGWIVQHEKPHLVENLTPDVFSFWEDPLLYQSGFRSILRVPIVFDHAVVGAILLASFEPGRFQIEDAMFIDQIAKFVVYPYAYAGIQLRYEYQTIGAATLLQTVISTPLANRSEEFLIQYCTQLQQNSKVDRVGICLLNKGNQQRCCIARSGTDLAEFGEWTPLLNTGIEEMLRTKSIVAFNLADPRFSNIEKGLAGRGFTAVLHAPIENQEGLIVACLTAVTRDERALSPAVAGIFKIASDQLGLILAKMSLGSPEVTSRSQLPLPSIPKGFEHIIGSSGIIHDTILRASMAAKYEFPILITGETGTGKELFAKAIHEASKSAQGPFIVVNSAAIPANLLESELFGYQEGAFTGGLKGGKKGKVLLADGGTLFLDEIGELSPELQAKILRIVQEQEVEPLGALKPIPVHVRIISATHRDLKQLVERGDFREDLLYRLNVIEIQLPPLRDRGNDILELADFMLQFLARSHGAVPKRLSQEARQQLLKYSWPGNVRQLQNAINRLFVFAEGQIIHVGELPPDIRNIPHHNSQETETQKLERLLLEFEGNKTALALYLGITRTGLWKKLKRLGIQ